ncbi:MAG TPA: MgtC/SapB family protein [Vicinamibacterales bacterium]|nr:MgtC/SapB family protein [Vicinamibacterales bacterium]
MMGDAFQLPETGDLVRVAWRLVVAALLGGCIGFEREWSRKAAGLRTHMTVALASAAFVLIMVESAAAPADVSRVIQGISAGIGFLGAGTILKRSSTEEGIKGLTTAATIWLTAAVGAAAGAGHVAIGVISVIAAWMILTILSGAERLIGRR